MKNILFVCFFCFISACSAFSHHDVAAINTSAEVPKLQFQQTKLDPNIFYIYDAQNKPVKSFVMDITLETPIYALVGSAQNIRSRVIAILRPQSLKNNTHTDTWVIVLAGNSANNPAVPYLYDVFITNKYKMINVPDIPESSFWKLNHTLGRATTLHEVVVDDSHSVHSQYWHCNVSSARIPGQYISGDDSLTITGILIPAFIRETVVEKNLHLYVVGYRPGKDDKISLVKEGEVSIFDQGLMKF